MMKQRLRLLLAPIGLLLLFIQEAEATSRRNAASRIAGRTLSCSRVSSSSSFRPSNSSTITTCSTITAIRGGSSPPPPPPLLSFPFLQELAQSSIGQGAQERRQYYRELPPQQVLGILLLPQRLLTLVITAFAAAQVLHQLGIIESNPDQWHTQFQKYWSDSGKPWTDKVMQQWSHSWNEARQPGGLLHADTYRSVRDFMRSLSKLPNRHQFAVGGAVGLVASPLVWTVGLAALKIATVTYLVSEVNYYIVTHEDDMTAGLKHTNMAADWKPSFGSSNRYNMLLLPPQLHGILERVRVMVRNLIKTPKAVLWAMWEDLDERLPPHFWELPPYVSRGLVLGTVAGLILVL